MGLLVLLLLTGCGGGGELATPDATVHASLESPGLPDGCADAVGCGTVMLLVDEAHFSTHSGLSRSLGTMAKVSDRPLIDGERFYGSALAVDGLTRLYVMGGRTYESTDGLVFQRGADLTGLFIVPGEPSVTVTRYVPGGKSAPVYLAAYPDSTMRANIAYSHDGLSFMPLNGGRPVVERAADTFNQLMYDPIQGAFRLSTRTDFGSAGGSTEIRGTRTMLNGDILAQPTAWITVSEWALSPRFAATDRQIYGKTEFIERGVYFALAMVYKSVGDLSEGPEDHVRRHDRDVIDLHLLTSRDGVTWDLHWIDNDTPLIQRGADGTFDKDLIVPAAQVITTANQHILYYSGADERHDHPNRHWGISRASVGRDRLVCQHGEDGTASFLPLPARQGFVGVNLDASRGRAQFWLSREGDAERYGPVTLDARDEVVRLPFNQFKRSDGSALQVTAGERLQLHARLQGARLCAVSM